MRDPSGEMATDVTQSWCPWRVITDSPASALTLAVSSLLPVTMRDPSGEIATHKTQ